MGIYYPGNIFFEKIALNKASKHNFHCVWLGKSVLRLTCQAHAWPQVSANGRITVAADSVELISGRANRICLATMVAQNYTLFQNIQHPKFLLTNTFIWRKIPYARHH